MKPSRPVTGIEARWAPGGLKLCRRRLLCLLAGPEVYADGAECLGARLLRRASEYVAAPGNFKVFESSGLDDGL